MIPRFVIPAFSVLAILTLAVFIPFSAADTNPRDIYEPQFLWGMVSPGEDPSEIGKDGIDDVGPPRAIRQKWMQQSGMTYWGVRAYWGDAEPKLLPETATEKDFNWTKFDRELDSVPLKMAAHCTFKLDAVWAQDLKKTDESSYWKFAERFIELAARRAHAHGVRYYGVPGNEMSLTGRPDWAELYMKPVRHYAQAIHRGNPDNQVIAGALVCGSKDLINELYKHGFKENCDVLDIHAYAGSPGEKRYNVGLSQILESHQALVEHGDGHKRIFLGEGWSVFPLPSHLDKLSQPPKYTADDNQHYRKAVVYGYTALTTPRTDYDPKWILGARFFCLNDLWGSMSWKKRATIEYTKDGDPAFWILDGYKLPYEPNAMDPQFRAWGLIDIDGNPKGDTIKQFPPHIPQSLVKAEFVDNLKTVIFPGVPCRVRVTFTNREARSVSNLRFSMDLFQGGNRKGIEFRDLGGAVPAEVASGESASHEFEVVAKPSLTGSDIRVQGGCEYDWRGQPYYTDGWLKIKVESPGAFELKQNPMMPSKAGESLVIRFLLANCRGTDLPGTLKISASDELTLNQSSKAVSLSSREYSLVVVKKDATVGGFYTIEANAGPSFAPIKAEIAFPNPGRSPEKTPVHKHLINSGFEEYGPGSGFEGWDGSPSNFEDADTAVNPPDHGKRQIAKIYNFSKYPTENSQTVLTPEGFASGRTVTASVMTKGVAFAGATDHDALRFRISVVFLGIDGKELRRDDSLFLKGTGKWEKLKFTTSKAPENTQAIKLILLHENTNHKGWHKAAMDNAYVLFN